MGITCVVTQGPRTRRASYGFNGSVLTILELFILFEQRALCFHFALGLGNYVDGHGCQLRMKVNEAPRRG